MNEEVGIILVAAAIIMLAIGAVAWIASGVELRTVQSICESLSSRGNVDRTERSRSTPVSWAVCTILWMVAMVVVAHVAWAIVPVILEPLVFIVRFVSEQFFGLLRDIGHGWQRLPAEIRLLILLPIILVMLGRSSRKQKNDGDGGGEHF